MGAADEQRMQRKAGKGASRQRNSFQGSQSEFINLELDKAHTEAYRVWRNDVENVFSLWLELIEGDYRVSVKWDDYSSSCAAFIIPGADSINDGFILTGRGGTPYRALAEAIYKHFEMLRSEWASSRGTRQGADDPDF